MLHRAISAGISILQSETDPRHFKNTFKANDKVWKNFRSSWWRYKGVRMNFAVLHEKYLVWYKCNRLVSYNSLQSLTRHLDSTAHKESCEIFHASQLGFPSHLKFPVPDGYASRATYTQLFECPFVREWLLIKQLSTRRVKSTSSLPKERVRNNYFDFCNGVRQSRGEQRLEHMPNNSTMLEVNAGFDYMYGMLQKHSKNSAKL